MFVFKLFLSLVGLVFGCYGYTTTYGTNNYVEHQVGEGSTKIIITTSHGGSETPSSITTRRTAGCLVNGACVFDHTCTPENTNDCDCKLLRDEKTKEIAIEIADEINTLTNGDRPHVVINNLKRNKLDANREVNEATFGITAATTAYNEFHGYIDDAHDDIDGPALLLDIHGQTHSEGWVELGYTVSKSTLNSGNFRCTYTSIEKLVKTKCTATEPQCDGDCFWNIFRLDNSLGTYLVTEGANIGQSGIQVVPSNTTLSPGANGNYYSGGYITKTHGSKVSGDRDAIQVEIPSWLRQDDTYEDISAAIARATVAFVTAHY